jgi:hypothetical protein
MPKVTSLPVAAKAVACATADAKAAWSAIRWSSSKHEQDGVLAHHLRNMQRVQQRWPAAVLRPKGSRMKLVARRLGLTGAKASWVLKLSSRLVTVSTCETPGNVAPRTKAFCRRLWPSASVMKGLGWCRGRRATGASPRHRKG